MTEQYCDIIIVGGGQSGLAVAYYLRRLKLDYLILDAENEPGGSWQHYWDSIKLFSPAQWSSLPGRILQGGTSHYPTREEMIQYLTDYEKHYRLKVQRPIEVKSVTKEGELFYLNTDGGDYRCKVLISTTGSFKKPIIPDFTGLDSFNGSIIHSAKYQSPTSFEGKRVGIIGEGNSGAQILAEVSKVADTYWITKDDPDFLPDHVDGKYLFDAASQLYEAKKKGKKFIPPSLGHIVMVPSVVDARERGVLKHHVGLETFTAKGIHLSDGTTILLDAIIFCTGYLPVIDYLRGLNISFRHNKVDTHGTRSRELPGLWMVGYGSWTGFASATVIGVGRSAKATAHEVKEYLS
ncbi:ArsO family NAD(P)H-dependent flavin-containing monooxygenase [Marinoscillum sp.]|uniref:ArsO family NAD(P)H-dependent flavin-containing monooxygenase n=1 Tax=Marinoscillum sp. TaxID=2024838 RepID=UPI003BAB8BA4